MTSANRESYGEIFLELIKDAPQPSLSEGSPKKIRKLTIDECFADHQIQDEDMAEACISGIYLLYNQLDRSHDISQNLHLSEGSFWHGIMHRREGDFWNSKYWFRQFNGHPIYILLGREVEELGLEYGEEKITKKLVRDNHWVPGAFVDLVERSIGTNNEEFCLAIQELEWKYLFNYCFVNAVE